MPALAQRNLQIAQRGTLVREDVVHERRHAGRVHRQLGAVNVDVETTLVVEDRRCALFADELPVQRADVQNDVGRGMEPHIAHLETDRVGPLRLSGGRSRGLRLLG